MLWYKGWLETRFRILLMLFYAVFPIPLFTLAVPAPNPAHPASLAAVAGTVGFFGFYYSIIPLMLAGSGIKTQADLHPRKGLHGSMYFTLSLPVSRFRLFATRAGLGMLMVAGVLAIAPTAAWIIFPSLRMHITGSDLFAYWVTFSVCTSAFYFLGVLLSTFLDDIWQNWTSMFGLVFLWWLLSRPFLPPSVNIFRAMGESSPLFTHTFPWASMGISLGVAAILFLAALRVVQTREY
jgi:hypothetical protein